MNLAGITEIAELLGVSKQRAHQIVNAQGFPKPLDRLAQGSVWKRSTVERWALERGRAIR